MKTLLFIDTVCPKEYDAGALEREGMGGTEATVIRVAEGIAKLGVYEVRLEQHNRAQSIHFDAEYLPLNFVTKAAIVVCLRDPHSLFMARLRFPDAKRYLWCHDMPGHALASSLPILRDMCHGLICVSEFHKLQTVELLKSYGYKGEFPVTVLYNPIEDDLVPDGTPYDRNQLVWLSSPHKGLDYGLKLYEAALRFNPDFTLQLFNPGYLQSVSSGLPGVHNWGTQPRAKILHVVRSSLCLFYPNTVFPETFGLVYAESNAVGTPVLAHSFGAATEVLDHPSETLDCRDPKSVIDRLMAWHSGSRPRVRGKDKFRLSRVVSSWMGTVLR